MDPLFGSRDPRPTAPHMAWRIHDTSEYVGKPMLLAGKVIGLNCHRVGRRTLPCLTEFPKLGRDCPHCERPLRYTTWVPLMDTRRPYSLVVIMGAKTTHESIQFLKPGQVIEPHWGLTLKRTPIFRREVTQIGVGQLNDIAKNEVPLRGDITRWLLHYWQWPALSQWFGEKYQESVRSRNQRERAELHGLSHLGKVIPD